MKFMLPLLAAAFVATLAGCSTRSHSVATGMLGGSASQPCCCPEACGDCVCDSCGKPCRDNCICRCNGDECEVTCGNCGAACTVNCDGANDCCAGTSAAS